MSDNFDKNGKVIPQREDIAAVERECGPLLRTATIEEQAERWQLYQVAALMRLFGPTYEDPTRRRARLADRRR